jgi:hypothetical protein
MSVLRSQLWALQYEQLGVSGVFPLVFFAQLGATLALYAAYQALRAKYRNGARPPIEWTPWIRTAVVLSLSCYTQVTNNVLLYLQVTLISLNCLAVVSTQCCCFQCVDIGASKVVFSVPAIDCSAGNSKYIGWLAVAVLLLIVFVIGLPAMILVFLCRNRWHLENDEDVAGALGPLFEVISVFECRVCVLLNLFCSCSPSPIARTATTWNPSCCSVARSWSC